MASRVYFDLTIAAPITPAYDAGWEYTTEAAAYKAQEQKTATSTVAAGTTIGPWSGTAGDQALDRQYLYGPLKAQTISGTIKGQIGAKEVASTDNVDQMILSVRVVSGDGSTFRGTLLALGNYGTSTEFSTSALLPNKKIADGDSLSSVDAQDGDYIVIEIGYGNTTTGTTPEVFATWGWNGTIGGDLPEDEVTSAVNGTAWIEFSQTLLLQRTQLYFSATPHATITPAYEGAWSDTSEASRFELVDVQGGTALAEGTLIGAWSGTGGTRALDRQYLYGPLAAQTIDGTVSMELGVRESNADDNIDQGILSIRVVSGDGLTYRGTLLALGSHGPTTEFSTLSTNRAKIFAADDALSSVVAQAGDYLVVEVGYSNSALGTTPSAAARWGDTGTLARREDEVGTTIVGWITFSDEIALFTGGGETTQIILIM